MNEVFVLGAGFSKALNPDAPLMGGFFNGNETLLEREGFSDVREFINRCSLGEIAHVNIESLMTLASLETAWLEPLETCQLSVVTEQLRKLIREVIDQTFPKREVDSEYFRRRHEAHAFRFNVPQQCQDSLDQFAKYLMTRDGRAQVISFNYDVLLENALLHSQDDVLSGLPDARNRRADPWFHIGTSYGFDAHVFAPKSGIFRATNRDPGETDICVLKLHGSTNWRCRRGHAGSVDPYDVLVLQCHHDPLRQNEPARRLIESAYFDAPFIVPPILDKSTLVRVPLLAVVWGRAAYFLGQAERLVFLGYSFPSTDFYSEFLFRYHTNPNCEIVVVGSPRPTGVSDDQIENWNTRQENLKSRYRDVFGRDVDWRDVGALEYCQRLTSA